MKLNLLEQNGDRTDLIEQWNRAGSDYAAAVNEVIKFGEENGFENWKGKEPEDKRDHLSENVYRLLKEANERGSVEDFRANFPPAHAPMIKFMEEKGQSVEQIHFVGEDKIVFLIGTAYQKRRAYLLEGDKVTSLESGIDAIGKSKQNNIFAVRSHGKIMTTRGWQGDVICSFDLRATKELGVTELIPFNDGMKILLVTSEGIFLISEQSEQMIHPVPDPDDGEWTANITMENATLSNDNNFIVVGDQCSGHRVLNSLGTEIGNVGPQYDYPHYCLFSQDDGQLITNSCHFYNGKTIGVNAAGLNGIQIESYKESDEYAIIDEGMRVYVGLATTHAYILGDAFGYIRAVDKAGRCFWYHFLGSTISGMAISYDESTLWVGSYSGMLHKLKLGKGHRDNHTIGNGNHFEDFRLIFWKEEPIMKW